MLDFPPQELETFKKTIMKKTLVALLALGSLAIGEEVSLFKIGTTTTTAATSENQGSYTSSVVNKTEAIDGLTGMTAQASSISGDQALSASAFTESIFSVQANIGNGGSYIFEQNFHVDLADGATITLTSINVDFFAHNNGGVKQTSAREISATLTLKRGAETLLDSTGVDVTIPGISGDMYSGPAYNGETALREPGVGTFTLPQSVNLSDGDYILSIAIAKKSSGGTYIGIGRVEAKGTVERVPEPTTGTLSLLALAGLAARRRRK